MDIFPGDPNSGINVSYGSDYVNRVKMRNTAMLPNPSLCLAGCAKILRNSMLWYGFPTMLISPSRQPFRKELEQKGLV
jgi:hypothetical protein